MPWKSTRVCSSQCLHLHVLYKKYWMPQYRRNQWNIWAQMKQDKGESFTSFLCSLQALSKTWKFWDKCRNCNARPVHHRYLGSQYQTGKKNAPQRECLFCGYTNALPMACHARPAVDITLRSNVPTRNNHCLRKGKVTKTLHFSLMGTTSTPSQKMKKTDNGRMQLQGSKGQRY